ncbi:MAG: hypothetical protein NBV66_11085 [Burkholderiaceae bacterium]|nr:hypothetical protein [Burkholderiaceae bacterium]
MSWRALTLFLLLAIVASWQGGRQLGLWLVDQAPESIASAFSPKNENGTVLDADGKPLAPQPPQPRIDGTLGVPKEMAPVEWTIAPVIASRADANSYNKDGEEDDERENEEDKETSSDSVQTVDVRGPGTVSATTRPNTPPPPPVLSWQESLRKELSQCNSVGFFRRPGCIDAAQSKYCGPNSAWGKIAECPEKTNTYNIGG